MASKSTSNRSSPSTEKWNKLLNSKPQYPLKSGGAANGVGRLQKRNTKA